MKKNEILQNIFVEKLVFGGKWFAKLKSENKDLNGKTIFISGWVIPWSIVNVRVLKSRKDYIEAQYQEIIQKSPIEKAHPNNIYGMQAGCGWVNIPYEEQLKIKTWQVEESLFHIRKLQPELNILPIVASPLVDNYRNKIEFSFWKFISQKLGKNEHFNVWFHKQWEFSKIEDFDGTILISELANTIYKEIKDFAKKSGYPVYDQFNQEWFFRHIVIRQAFFTNQIMIIFWVNHNYIPHPTPLLTWEGIKNEKVNNNVFDNYYNSPEYIKNLAKELRKNLTKWEDFLWKILRNRNFMNVKFRRQHPFWRYIADFYTNELWLVIELDGQIHENQKEYDKLRDEIIKNYWVEVIRIKNEELNDLESLLNKLKTIISPRLEGEGLGVRSLDFIKNFFLNLAKKYPEITSVYLSLNDSKADTAIWELQLIYGKEYIEEKLLGLTFNISPKSFFQTNSYGAEKLYSEVLAQVDTETLKDYTVLDLYGGTGTIGMVFAPHAKKVISVELVKDASEDGKENALKNSLKNMDFVNAKVEEFLDDYLKKWETADLLIIDPPRAGMHPDALPNILKFKTKNIIYVSCNPATLSRDLAYILQNSDYKIVQVIPVDMFPHTPHIETIVKLEKI